MNEDQSFEDIDFNENDIEEDGFGDSETGSQSLNSGPPAASEETIKEILNDLIDYVAGQGEVEPSDEELKGVIDDYLYEKMDQGEIHEDAPTDVLRLRILEEYKQRSEDQFLEEEEDEF